MASVAVFLLLIYSLAIGSFAQGMVTGSNKTQSNTSNFCNPSPCGQNTDCTIENGRPVCSCKSTYIGDPLKACSHECEQNEDCSADKGCRNYRCKDPCVGGCGDFARCQVRNHQAICSCPDQFGGNAYVKCIPECSSQDECPSNLSCIDLHCGDPCIERPDLCAANTNCKVERHQAVCTCKPGYIGDPVKNGCRRAF